MAFIAKWVEKEGLQEWYISALHFLNSCVAVQGDREGKLKTVIPSNVSTDFCPSRLGTTANTSSPRFTSSRPIRRVARPNPPNLPQAKISTQIKQILIRCRLSLVSGFLFQLGEN